jgi:hypothetical protein
VPCRILDLGGYFTPGEESPPHALEVDIALLGEREYTREFLAQLSNLDILPALESPPVSWERETLLSVWRAHKCTHRIINALESLDPDPSDLIAESDISLIVWNIEPKFFALFIPETEFTVASKRSTAAARGRLVSESSGTWTLSIPGDEAFFGFLLPPKLPLKERGSGEEHISRAFREERPRV